MRHFLFFPPPCDQLKRPRGVRDVYLFVPSVLFRVPSVEIVRTVLLASECIHNLFLYIHVMQYDNFCYSSCIAPFPLFISHVNILFFSLFFFLLMLWPRGRGWGHSRVVNNYQILVLNWKRALMMADTISMPDIVTGVFGMLGSSMLSRRTVHVNQTNTCSRGLREKNAISFWFSPFLRQYAAGSTAEH